ncbi:MAG: aminodeoxychorismate/anthranilate synthase component II [Flavobacteriaceae bacterium]|nr:aminodeoxychorismate/anthranilate synthase component II [Flavobacteriaceae bacterium]
MKILVIDNYDSFVFNLVHYLEEFSNQVTVVRNDEVDLESIQAFDAILLSPGPGIPEEAGLLKKIIAEYAGQLPILGVCLGQQAITEVFGGSLHNLSKVYHGVATSIKIIDAEEVLFQGLASNLEIGRYHSWVVHQNLPDCLLATSVDDEGQIMSLRHKEYDVRAVQFHPESVLTPTGKKMIEKWVNHLKTNQPKVEVQAK